MRLLLMSNSRMEGLGHLEHARTAIADVLGGAGKRVLLVPWAAVVRSPDDYLDFVRPVFAELGCTVEGIHRSADPGAAVAAAGAIVLAGGNTWHLVRQLHLHGVMDVIRRAVRGGTPYVGWSAGANVACPTFQTTNDMPICDPLGFETLGLVPFQLNPHYVHGKPAGVGGETREERILEYIALHPGVWVAGLRDGLMFRVEDGSIRLLGSTTCRVWRNGEAARELGPDDDFGFLLHPDPGTF
jgi:dipeptidase E